ncbi:MAG: hypothetical protein R3D05_21145 [Dongiaceae bacterium]
MADFTIGEFIGVTMILFGFTAFLMGQAIAETWRPIWHNLPFGILLALGNHFIDCALFEKDWLSFGHYLLDAAWIVIVSLFAYRITMARKMVTQYPWLYERAGLLSWRERTASGAEA